MGDIYVFVGAIVITHDFVGATTIALDSIGAATTTLDYSRLCRVRGLIAPAFVGAALNTPGFVGSYQFYYTVLSGFTMQNFQFYQG